MSSREKDCFANRSAVPDLLFEDVVSDRIEEIAPALDQPESLRDDAPLHRVTVFVTYGCNLDCPYCKTIARDAEELRTFPQKAVTFSYEAFASLIASLDASSIRHLHFTGGEATLVRDLPRMVQLARAQGIAHLSITSNGTLPLRNFATLIDAGITEIRISIDARDPAMGALLTGRTRSWEMAVRNIQGLAALRDAHHSFFLIANTVISAANRREMAEIVRFLISLGVDDVKLITVVDEKATLGDFPEGPAVVREIEHLLSGRPAGAFPLLRRKLQTVFSEQAIGLEDVPPPADGDWRCYIPLTERTVDGVYYYPCSVYLREGGTPLGRISETAAVQRAKTARFVRHGRCLDDPICRQYCLHCTKVFNVAANAARRHDVVAS